MTSPALVGDMVMAFQEVGVIRRDLDPQVLTHIMDMISYGLVGITDQKPATAIPPFDALMETIAEMLDHFLAPPGGADSAAGKCVIDAWASKMQGYFDGVESTGDSEGKR